MSDVREQVCQAHASATVRGNGKYGCTSDPPVRQPPVLSQGIRMFQRLIYVLNNFDERKCFVLRQCNKVSHRNKLSRKTMRNGTSCPLRA